MSNNLNPQELQLASQLSAAGIPLDAEALKANEAACRGLVIYPGLNIPDTRIFDLDFGGTGYMITLEIHNESPRILWPHEVRLETPWWEPRFRLLEDPLRKIPREYTYDFPKPGPVAFDRDDVLNHRLRHKARLLPGDYMEGFLLAVGQEPMPSDYREHQVIKMQLWIFDEQGNRYGARIPFLVNRQGKRLRELKLLEQLSSPEAVARR